MKMPIVVLSLARLEARRAHLLAALDGLGLSCRLHDGLDRISVNEAEVRRRYADPGAAFGDVCCTLSHLGIWRGLVASGASAALVLEDDAIPSDDLPRWVREAMPAMQDLNLDVLKLEAWGGPGLNRRQPLGRSTPHPEIFRLKGRFVGSAAYVIRADAAARLLGATPCPDRPVDHLLFTPDTRVALRVGFAAPAPVLHDPTRFGVDIERPTGQPPGRLDTLISRLTGARRVPVSWSGHAKGAPCGAPKSMVSA